MTLGPAVNDSPLPKPPTRVPGEDVPFTSVWQGLFSGCSAGWTEVASLATTEEEYADILALVAHVSPPSGYPSWEGLDLGTDEGVINIMIGCTGGCTRDVTVKSVVKSDEHALSIDGEYGFMGPEKACPADSPNVAHLVRIPWDGTPASETELNLVLYPAYR